MKIKQITMIALMATTVLCGVEAMAASCTKQGSSQSIDWIKKKYKNCASCGTQKDKKGKTVYYCYCGDGCGADIKKAQKAGVVQKAKDVAKESIEEERVADITKAEKAGVVQKAKDVAKESIEDARVADITKAEKAGVVQKAKDIAKESIEEERVADITKAEKAGVAQKTKGIAKESIEEERVADITKAEKTVAQKSRKQCKKGSSVSEKWIKQHYKNCKNCGVTKDKKGKKTYHCICDC